jgi:uncharacterized protein YbjT (DUF2867 family)
MTIAASRRRVLVTGGGTFLGDHIAAALVAEGADVTLLVRPGAEDKLGGLAERVRWAVADVWDAASLRGRARGHACVVHTVGSLTADAAHGFTHQRLNFVSARNVANMCSSDGVPHMILMSTANAPWLNGQYVAAKREAEEYLIRVGVSGIVVRAPVTYSRGAQRSLFWRLMSVLRYVPPLGWLWLNRIAPLPVDILARAVARAAMNPRGVKPILYAPDLRKLNSRDELAGRAPRTEPDSLPSPMETLPDDIPIGFRTRGK